MVTLHKYRITWYKVSHHRQEMGTERLERDCMKSQYVRAKCTRLLKRLLAEGERDTVYIVQFSNETLGISSSMGGRNGKIVRGWY